MRILPPVAALLLASCGLPYSPEEAARRFASPQRPAPQVRYLSEPMPGLLCGEVRWRAVAGDYGSWRPFHIRDGAAAVDDFPDRFVPSDRPADPAEARFYAAHRPCPPADGRNPTRFGYHHPSRWFR